MQKFSGVLKSRHQMRRRSNTNPIPPGTVNVSVNMPLLLREQLQLLADRSSKPGEKVSLSQYCKRVLSEAAKSGHLVDTEHRLVLPERTPEQLALNETPPKAGGARASPKR